MRAKLGNVCGITAIGPDDRLLEISVNRKRLSSDPDNKFIYEKETRTEFAHTDENTELEYIKEYVECSEIYIDLYYKFNEQDKAY